jgi:polysaccharide biosynthesis/export protein
VDGGLGCRRRLSCAKPAFVVSWVWLVALLAVARVVGAQETPDYVLGPGDVLRITVFEHQDMTTEARVSESGKIRFPLVGEVVLGGLTVNAAEARLAESLRSGGFLLKPQVNLLVTQFRSKQVSVLGQVNRPGRYPIDSALKLSDALALAGGVAVTGADFVTLTRGSGGTSKRMEISQDAAFHSGDLSLDVPVESGDVIFVSRAPQFYIHGEVQRPGTFRLEPGMTVNQALAAGGGVTPRGSERYVKITRKDRGGKSNVINAKLADPVQEDDTIFVNSAMFYIYGEVQRPGAFRVEPNMTVMQALSLGGGVTPRGTDKGIKLTRRDNSGKAQAYDATLEDLIQADDVIYVKERLF